MQNDGYQTASDCIWLSWLWASRPGCLSRGIIYAQWGQTSNLRQFAKVQDGDFQRFLLSPLFFRRQGKHTYNNKRFRFLIENLKTGRNQEYLLQTFQPFVPQFSFGRIVHGWYSRRSSIWLHRTRIMMMISMMYNDNIANFVRDGQGDHRSWI